MRASAAYEPAPADLVASIQSYLSGRLGIAPQALDGFRLWHRPGATSVWIAADTAQPTADIDPETMGLVLMRDAPPRGFPTTEFLQRFGHLATRQVARVTEAQAVRLMNAEQLPVTDFGGENLADGLVVVVTDLSPVGRGWLRNGLLRVDFPKIRRIRLAEVPACGPDLLNRCAT